ncbi:unnamed protein product [Toxocara canis]|uniref:MITF_TFEB_C_3_N domain-containing protein n=1 Tax=Toxocara canis TaxID=6265 RepID=A0A183U1M8_TOXCA|nr:unnamed protein product [Toxocara canis]
MNSTDVRSTYSGWSPCSEPSAFNMTSASQQRDPALQTAAVVSAYQTGLIEGRYQERCNRYADQIRYLTESLDHANRELCRISGLPQPTASCLNRTFPAASEVGVPLETSPQLPTGFDMRSVPILDSQIVTQVALASSAGKQNEHVSKPSTSATSTDQKMETVMDDVSRTDSSQADVQRNEKCVEGQSRKRERQIVEATKDSLASDASRPTATAKASKDVISEEGEREEWMVDESEDSNTFNSEEEDSEEERLFNEMLKEMKQEDEKRAENNTGENKSGETPPLLSAESDSASPPGPSTSRRSKFSSDSADPSSMTATNSSVGTSSSGAESSRPTYILPSLNPPILRQV